MQSYNWTQLDPQTRAAVLARAEQVQNASLSESVTAILRQVRLQGDQALVQLSERFDGQRPEQLVYDSDELARRGAGIEDSLKQAIDTAIDNLDAFHRAQAFTTVEVETQPGVRCELRSEAIERVGLYVPGGSAPLVSSVLMQALPARIAGCRVRVMATPPPVSDAICYAAWRCGIQQLFPVGGAQAIAALAYGTETVPRVDKIFGPGNRFVTEAKTQVSVSGTAIDMPAGPSEVLVIADDNASPAFVAADLLSQAEHGEDSQAMLVCLSQQFANQVDAQLQIQLSKLSRRAIATQALAQSRTLICDTLAQACDVSNRYGPEHLIVQTDDPRALLPSLRAAGSIFLGRWSPESVGDYASGTNHVLPTYGASRSASSLSLADFCRRYTVQQLSRDGLLGLANTVMTLANAEGLDAHANAVALRLQTPSTARSDS
ncbi:histidinol dehydrogenase [Ferrimonas sp. SCSIO 43195]|uniref:histidinol dehydrogenase n=1 Tax=Ferrimonas sp. SCSIO 43195 TaxID=2822844 RepID=UPI00207626C9|nr:histidinol dehydrogenase [Ferrimonas sp. SCSIO 43195]USD39205.1 histidinol dehydrogenase [Ferrimonas sp. SCSIO 43195]